MPKYVRKLARCPCCGQMRAAHRTWMRASGICARCRRQRPHHDTLDWEEAEQRRLRSAFQKAGIV